MRDLLRMVYIRVKEMPLLVRFFFAVCPCGIFFIIFSIFPMAGFKIDGREVTYQEWWSSRAGLETTVIGIVLIITGIGIFKKKKWAKLTFLSLYFISIFLSASFPAKEVMCIMSLWFLFLGWYLFFKESVKTYFSSGVKN